MLDCSSDIFMFKLAQSYIWNWKLASTKQDMVFAIVRHNHPF